ncbi:hypothetical protein HYH02_015338 [Chlamydomonas schloesseri]|uniref:Uncharacterized protein n=1 Tax=Chlamydomonas schloesseri TaxID=2026947 RepID=A0A835SNY4_9CHLO|nr:hypothetical protein HYH02_015338 [Chlamydomonas schloesseri]|eukprot:KAG2423366.1 hypothetical protein HYH02_015338 [Chlamydomonas schloesseri]
MTLLAKPLPEVAGGRTLLLTAVWLRRTGGGQAGGYPLPHQAANPERETLRGLLWVEDVEDQSLRGPASHAAMPIQATGTTASGAAAPSSSGEGGAAPAASELAVRSASARGGSQRSWRGGSDEAGGGSGGDRGSS